MADSLRDSSPAERDERLGPSQVHHFMPSMIALKVGLGRIALAARSSSRR
jgi:hypothetical protein